MGSNIDWNDTIKKEARGVNGENLGEVQEVTDGYVLVQRGLANKEKYYIPQGQAKSLDGSVLKFIISEDEIKSKYMSSIPPPSTSFTKPTSSRIQRSEDNNRDFRQKEEETIIPITEEKLDVSKHIKEDYINITKEAITEVKKAQILLTHEEVTIERRPPSGDIQIPTNIFSAGVIKIPFKKEEAVVNKKPYVKEEIVVKKKPITETKRVTGDIESGAKRVTGDIKSGAKRVTGDIEYEEKRVTGDIESGAKRVTGDIEYGAKRVTGDIESGAKRVTGDIESGENSISNWFHKFKQKAKYILQSH